MPENEPQDYSIGTLVPGFLMHIEVERHFAKESIVKYRDCMRQVRRIVGDVPVYP